MKAARYYGKEDLRIEDAPDSAPPGPGQVRIRNGFAGICGSDLHIYFYPESLPMDLDKEHPLTGAKLPQILGHEFCGTVVELGEGVTDVAIGDRAAVFPLVASCGECEACRRGLPFSCRLMGSLGATARGGGLSEFTTVDASALHILPDNVDLKMGALVEPMAVGWHAVSRSGAQAGATALVAGAGPVGIGTWFAFKARGVDKVLVSEPNAERRSIIEALGATVVDPTSEDFATVVDEFTGGRGMDVAVDAAGVGAALMSALGVLAPGGRVVVVALHEHATEFQPTHLMMGETEIVGAVGYRPEEFDAVIDAMSRGVYDTTGWVEEVSLGNVVESIHALRNGTGTKVLIDISR